MSLALSHVGFGKLVNRFREPVETFLTAALRLKKAEANYRGLAGTRSSAG